MVAILSRWDAWSRRSRKRWPSQSTSRNCAASLARPTQIKRLYQGAPVLVVLKTGSVVLVGGMVVGAGPGY